MDVFHLGLWALHVFNTWLSHGKKHSCYVHGNHHLVESIVIHCKKELLVSSRLLCWPGKERLRSQFNCLFHLGVKEVEDIVEALSQRILQFVEARQLLCIPLNYGFIWEQIQNSPLIKVPHLYK